jgi:hypothetical protein
MTVGVLASLTFNLTRNGVQYECSFHPISSSYASHRRLDVAGYPRGCFLAAGSAKLAGVPFMVDCSTDRTRSVVPIATGVVEVTGAVALLVPGLASIGALWLGSPWSVPWQPMCSCCTPVRSRRSSWESSTRWLSTCGAMNSLPCFTGSRVEL